MTTHAVRILAVDNEGKALLHLRREKGQYFFCFFGGKVESGEEPEAAAIRELAEETGLKVNASDLQYLKTWTNPEGVEVLHYKLNKPVSWKDISNGEDFGLAMVPYADLPAIPLALSMQWFYQQYPKLP
jgi:8-oxo-dGTP diphosphatase